MRQTKENKVSILDQATVPTSGPQVISICGDAGTGKSSLAASFPKPIFIRAEDGVARIPASFRPSALPLIENSDQLWEQIIALLREEHDYKTVVFDTVSALDRIFVQDVLKSDPKAKALNSCLGGYGAGFNALSSMHQRVRKAAEHLRQKRGMNVVFIAHAEIGNVSPPDGEDYSRYSLRMTHHKSLPPYIDDVDAVGFLRQQMVVKGDEGERKRAISMDGRELVCHLTANNVSKNAYGITQPVPVKLGVNPLAAFIPTGDTHSGFAAPDLDTAETTTETETHNEETTQ